MYILNNKREYILLFVIYIFANILNIINYDGIYWDDYMLFNQDYEHVKNIFYQALGGLNLATPFHTSLLYFDNSILLYRLVVYISYFFSGILIFRILQTIKSLNNDNIFFIVLLYLLVPLNSAKIALINAPATFYILFFFIAFYLFSKYLNSRLEIYQRVLLYMLFFISFSVNSLLVFYALVLIYALYRESELIEFKIDNYILFCKKYLYKYFDFMLLPIIYFVIKSKYFVPFGLYENYNSVHMDYLNIYTLFEKSLYTSLYKPIQLSVLHGYIYWEFSVAIFIIFMFLFKNISLKNRLSISIVFMIIGIFSYILAVFPYLAVSKLPELFDWYSRHQTLMPLGLSFLLYSIVLLATKVNSYFGKILASYIITIFTIQTFYNSYIFTSDVFYQDSIVENFKDSTIIKENKTLYVSNGLRNYLANNRILRVYEYSGLLKKAYGDQKRVMVDSRSLLSALKDQKQGTVANSKEWKYSDPKYLIIINKNKDFTMNYKSFYSLLYKKWFQYNKYKDMVSNIVVLQEKKL